MNRIFLCAPLYISENCHTLIDYLVINLQDLPSTHQAVYLKKIEHLLRKEFALRLAESAMNILDISNIIEESKELGEDDIGIQSYSEFDPEIRSEYIQRDREVLKRIQEDDDLRHYIEGKIGKKAEEIFNYAAFDK